MGGQQPVTGSSRPHDSSRTLVDHTLRTAPLTVIKDTAAFTAVGAVAGSATGIIRNIPAMPAAFSTAVNVGMFSFTFFSLREYLIRPTMVAFDLHKSPLDHSPPTTLQLHTHNLAPSFVAGLSGGTVFHSFVRGTRGSIKAGFTLGLGCLVFQGIVNEASLLRIKVLANVEQQQNKQQQRLDPSTTVTPPTLTNDPIRQSLSEKVQATHEFDNKPRPTFSEQSDRLFASASNWVKRKVHQISPVTTLSQQEYIEKLEKQLDIVERQKQKVQQELDALEKK
ncbi:hypothetical protein OIV83_002867 [Microbotryomycetes sp. JL201]|nr:hypothetical protein OIV83_002867 [Microbotryomycetes sp. JL201]